MEQPAFLIGRFLSLVDTLHREYCNQVREGDLPPYLLGNSLIPVAVSNPERSLGLIQQRIRVYQGWASSHGSGLARWSLAELGRISASSFLIARQS